MDKEIRALERQVMRISKQHKGPHNEKRMQKDISGVLKNLKSLEKKDKINDQKIEKYEKMMKKKK